MIENAEELKAFFDKLVTQLDVLQRFFLASQERIINLERQMQVLTEHCLGNIIREGEKDE